MDERGRPAPRRADRRDRHPRRQRDARATRTTPRPTPRRSPMAGSAPATRAYERGGLRHHHRPAQGDHQSGRREDLPARGGRGADGPSRDPAGGHLRDTHDQPRRGRCRRGGAARRDEPDRARRSRVRRAAAGRLQGPAQGRSSWPRSPRAPPASFSASAWPQSWDWGEFREGGRRPPRPVARTRRWAVPTLHERSSSPSTCSRQTSSLPRRYPPARGGSRGGRPRWRPGPAGRR